MPMLSSLIRLTRDARGNAVVEFGFILPLFLLILAGCDAEGEPIPLDIILASASPLNLRPSRHLAGTLGRAPWRFEGSRRSRGPGMNPTDP